MLTDQCIWAVALTKEEIALCDGITDEPFATRCRGVLLGRSAVSSRDPTLCVSIADEAARRACLMATIRAETPASFCETLSGQDKIVCIDSRTILASGFGDMKACETITDEELEATCLASARRAPLADTDRDALFDDDERNLYRTDPRKADTDGDGINDGDEIKKWNTDPTKGDTDGDGFDDGTEIEKGYNPAGPGRLP
jgi:hypothetical protein